MLYCMQVLVKVLNKRISGEYRHYEYDFMNPGLFKLQHVFLSFVYPKGKFTYRKLKLIQ